MGSVLHGSARTTRVFEPSSKRRKRAARDQAGGRPDRQATLGLRVAPMTPSEPVTHRTYESVGRCIYCGSTEPPLTDEHIIPEGLGGREILPAASCKCCEKITGRFEQMVMRHAVWPMRRHLGMKGKKRSLPPTIPAKGVRPDGSLFTEEQPHETIGFKGALPVFREPPGFMLGRAPTDRIGIDWDVFYDPERIRLKDQPCTVIELKPEWFAMMLAKIAHAKAVGALGLDGFDAFLPLVILGKDGCWPYFVGAAPIEPLGPQHYGHWVNIYRQGPPHEGIVLGRLRLFAELDGPIYDVVIGRLREAL